MMDVLSLIKEDHQSIRVLIGKLSDSTTLAARRKLLAEISNRLEAHLDIESEYLYPEVSDLFIGAQGFISSSTVNQLAIKRGLKKLKKLFEVKSGGPKEEIESELMRLSEVVERHLDEEESNLMPKMRELISTQEREDLGLVYIDLLSN